jgi:hypothetical protein
MSAIEQAIAWMDLDKRCGGYGAHCLKCDGVLQRKFDTADSDTHNFLADTLCACSLEDFETNSPLLWLVALLNSARYEQFVAGIASLAPYSRDTAWQIIRLSENNKGNWCFMLEPYRKSLFKPRFHLHPAVAASLLAATIRPEAEIEDALALFDYFEPVAMDYPVLKRALPAWQAELDRRAEARKATEARAKADWMRLQEQKRIKAAEWANRESEFRTIESRGPMAVMSAVLASPSLGGWGCSDRWARISEKDLDTMPQEILLEVVKKISSHHPSRIWLGLRSRIENLQKSRAHAEDRHACLAKLQELPLPERLHSACASNWSLTYFPEEWAEEVLQGASQIPPPLRNAMLSKLTRLRQPCRWRDVRQALLRQAS